MLPGLSDAPVSAAHVVSRRSKFQKTFPSRAAWTHTGLGAAWTQVSGRPGRTQASGQRGHRSQDGLDAGLRAAWTHTGLRAAWTQASGRPGRTQASGQRGASSLPPSLLASLHKRCFRSVFLGSALGHAFSSLTHTPCSRARMWVTAMTPADPSFPEGCSRKAQPSSSVNTFTT